MSDCAVYEADLFANEAIADPYPHYKRIRDAGPVVYLAAHDIYAIGRYSDVKSALLAHDKLVSGRGIGAFEFPPPFNIQNTISSDEPKHAKYRKIVGTPLLPPALTELTQQVETAAEDVIRQLLNRESFDVIKDLARILPVSIVSTLVGLPEQGRERMLVWAAAAFDALGADNDRAKAAFGTLGEMMHYIQAECGPAAVKPGSLASQLWQSVEQGTITPFECGLIMGDIVAPALDTTIFATGHLLHQLGKNPDQWEKLKQNPSLLQSAVDEAIRIESPIRAFARVAVEDQNISGTILPADARVLVIFASANRDERKWESPDRYWIERPGLSGHVGFGQGRHVCAGMHLAKLEIRSLLKAMLTQVDSMKVETPVYCMNNILRGFDSLQAQFMSH